ncbi:LacI family transcriptional regulator [Salinibacillus kushneri]|uniref:LacI family transcriptional regulator n=1 Tax=Salinibacillus kushneri TaxID=237682 RepID=A0A1H9Z1A5_9BACI|nr:substrate-binding domain-containing protein [Salinibacillus kushneri]SES75167.1 LacI family transcriptional regulator [Salinibacillus kushneri]
MTTIYDVAKRANVSAMTVSRVINNASSIKKETRLRVEKAIKELDYIPNRSAQSLTSKDTRLLSLIVTDVTNPFYTRIARGAEDKAHEEGYQLVFSNSDENIEKESSYIRSAISRGIDGILFTPSGDDSRKNIKFIQKHNIPVVLIDRYLDGIELDSIIGDNHTGTKKLMNHLYEYGHRKIGFVTGPNSVSTTRERMEGFKSFIEENHLPYNQKWVFTTNLTNMKTSHFIKDLLTLPKEDRPTAIFCTNNFLAVDLMNSLNNIDLKVPDDISIVCFDDPQPIPMHNSFFTVVSQQPYEYGYIGLSMLINRIEGKQKEEQKRIVYTPELMIRHSTKIIN